MTNLDENKLDEIKQRSALAHKYICELAAGKHRWNMCIPPQPDDSDMALQAPIDDINFLLDKIKRLEAERNNYKLDYEHLLLIKDEYFKSITKLTKHLNRLMKF